jgi:hypothetical protein
MANNKYASKNISKSMVIVPLWSILSRHSEKECLFLR